MAGLGKMTCNTVNNYLLYTKIIMMMGFHSQKSVQGNKESFVSNLKKNDWRET